MIHYLISKSDFEQSDSTVFVTNVSRLKSVQDSGQVLIEKWSFQDGELKRNKRKRWKKNNDERNEEWEDKEERRERKKESRNNV